MTTTHVRQPDKNRRGYRDVTVIGLPGAGAARRVIPKPVERDIHFTATSSPELIPGKHGAGASPLFEFLSQRVEQD